MKVVLDTNVLVSGLLKAHSDAGAIVRLIAAGLLTVVYDARIYAEYREVLRRPKFGFENAEIKALLTLIEAEGVVVTARPLPERLPDPDDEPFLEVARAVEDAVLVTGNMRHFVLPGGAGVPVLGPAEFLARWRKLT
jgi:putative PIN family toxin of toxin-antitoxin system